MECFRWEDFASTYRLDKLDLWSLDIDDAEEQLQILSKMDLSSASRPSVIMIEASSGTVAKYKQILHANGYLTTHLEDNGNVVQRLTLTYLHGMTRVRLGSEKVIISTSSKSSTVLYGSLCNVTSFTA